jgi:hypothetical protein
MEKAKSIFATDSIWNRRRFVMKDVISSVYMGEYRIEVTFEDGNEGIVDLSKYLKKGGFERLKDKEIP